MTAITIAAPIDADALRIRHEFLSLPELHASAEDVATFLNISSRHAEVLLESLVGDGFLLRMNDARYTRSQVC